MHSRGEIGEYVLGTDGRVYMRTRSGIKEVPPSIAVGMIADDLRQRRRERIMYVAMWSLSRDGRAVLPPAGRLTTLPARCAALVPPTAA